MNHIKFLFTMVMAIILCLGNVSAMEPEKQPNRVRTGNQKEDNTQRMMLLFAVQKGQMGIFIRTIGLQRATVKLSLANMAYNIKRLVFWENRRVLTG